MTYEIYRYIFLGGAILAGIMLVVSILVFIFLKIPNVIGDLTGANARKAIENIRNQNEKIDEKTYRTSRINRERGRLTDKISSSGRLVKQNSYSENGMVQTAKIGTQRLAKENAQSNETTVLSEVLSSGAETTVLNVSGSVAETTVLEAQGSVNEFTVEFEITYIHTDEAIA